jgi:hypothetical protein
MSWLSSTNAIIGYNICYYILLFSFLFFLFSIIFSSKNKYLNLFKEYISVLSFLELFMITFIFIISINYIVELFTYLIIVFNKLNNLQFNIAELNLDLNSLNITGNTVNSTVDPVSFSTYNTESSGSTNSSSSPSNTQGNNTTENTYRKYFYFVGVLLP